MATKQYEVFLSCAHTIKTPNKNVRKGDNINCGLCRAMKKVINVTEVK